MNVDEARREKLVLQSGILELLTKFEQATGLLINDIRLQKIHNIENHPGTGQSFERPRLVGVDLEVRL